MIDGRIFLTGKVNEPEEKIKITKLAWETKGVRSVKNAIKIKGNSSFKRAAKDILITSQLRSALFLTKNKSEKLHFRDHRWQSLHFGIAMDKQEKKEVIDEANKIYDVQEVVPSIYLVSELSRSKF